MTQTADAPDETRPGAGGQPIATALQATKEHLAEVLPAAAARTLAEEQARLRRTSDPSRYIRVGSQLPSASLPDAAGRTTPVVRSGRPAVVVFYRGAWCPFCNVALAAYQREVLPELRRRGVDLVAISPQGPSGSEEVTRAGALTFPVLTDEGGAYARTLGLSFDLADDVRVVHGELGNDFGRINAGGEWALPRPTVLVVDAAGVVRWIDVRADYTERTEPAAVLAAVRGLGVED